jgi:uncharacterized protein YecE (DUF72 family)
VPGLWPGLYAPAPAWYAAWPFICTAYIMGDLYCGTSGLVLPVPNKQAFPEAFRDRTRLTYYSSLLNSIEINSSHYKVPQQATFAKWADSVPAAFRFSVKLWQGITHTTGLQFNAGDIIHFMHSAAGLGLKRGCLLVQLPPGARVDRAGQLEKLLRQIALAEGEKWMIAVEFRHGSWYTPETDALLKAYGAGGVLQDMPASKLTNPMGDTSFIYIRYHGPAGDYRGGYLDRTLREDAARMQRWLAQRKDLYVYFNNTIGDAFNNVRSLRSLISSLPTAGGA